MGIKSIFVIFKFSWWKLTLFSGWNARYHAIGYYYNEHTVAFYAIIIIILLIVVYVIYLESNPEEDYLIRPYQVLLGISLVAIVIYIIATAPEQKELEKVDYKYADPYEDEKQWLTEDSTCQNLEDENYKNYCIEIKKECAELIDSVASKYLLPLSSKLEEHTIIKVIDRKCINSLREKLGMPTKIIYENVFDAPYTSWESLEKKWVSMSIEKKLSVARLIIEYSGTTYDQFPDWMKNDPVILEIKEELQQISSDN